MKYRHYQTGGGILPTVPAVAQPALPAAPAGIDFSAYNQAQAMAMQRAAFRERQIATREAKIKAQEARENAVLDLQGEFNMPVHNEFQQSKLSEIASRYGISGNDLKALNYDNQFQIKDMEKRFKRAIADPEFQQVQGQIAAASKLREKALSSLGDKEILEWEKSWKEYQEYAGGSGMFDINRLGSERYKAVPPTDFTSTVTSVRDAYKDSDLSNQGTMEAITGDLKFRLMNQDLEGAVESGLLISDGEGGYSVSEDAVNMITGQIRAIAEPEEFEDVELGGELGAEIESEAQVRGIDPQANPKAYHELRLEILKKRRARKLAGKGGKGKKPTQTEVNAAQRLEHLEMVGIDTAAMADRLEMLGTGVTATRELVLEEFDPQSIQDIDDLNALMSLLNIKYKGQSGITEDQVTEIAAYYDIYDKIIKMYKDNMTAQEKAAFNREEALGENHLSNSINEMVARVMANVMMQGAQGSGPTTNSNLNSESSETTSGQEPEKKFSIFD